ncbi:hypothetical protein [Parapedobacter koreensis]|uniref:LytTr DNA-binding domain-containing protein n=1 Tax=Parapedobacter koreensis TaxID=332977 RepID=A0A1H7TWV6_9SPHI|nr:hypothetical protein [Parapedobacter koreensis]SEL88896.1 hypothetical protein SAMN05421740_112121 [Parapedobacter koreensis]
MFKQLSNNIKTCFRNLGKRGEQRYIPRRHRLWIAVPLALLMVLVGKRWAVIGSLLTSHKLLLLSSFLGSYVIVVVVWEFATWATQWLDAQSDWRKDFKNRLFMQIALPLVGSWGLSILMAMGLYWIMGIDINSSGYFRFEVWIVLFLLVALSFGYAFWYLHRQVQLTEPAHETAYITVTYNKEKLIVSERDIGCVIGGPGFGLVHMINGDIYHTGMTITALENVLDPVRFYKLKRRYLINGAIIIKLITDKETKHDEIKGTEIATYKWMLRFGNGEMGMRNERLVKGSMKHVDDWWQRYKRLSD